MKWGVRNEETLARYARAGINVDINFTGGGGYIEEPLDEANLEEIENNPEYWKFKEHEMTADEDMLAINPYYELAKKDLEQWATSDPDDAQSAFIFNQSRIDEKGYSPYTFNCATCSLVYDLRRRGFDVDANGTTNMAMQFNTTLSDYYNGAKTEECMYVDDMISNIRKTPVGSRGAVAGMTVKGGGHAIAWENDGVGGITFRDCQTGKKYSEKNIDQVFAVNKKNKPNQQVSNEKVITWVRLDDKKPNYRRLREDGIISNMSNNKNETEKDRIRSVSGYYKIQRRKKNRDLKKYESYTDSPGKEQLLDMVQRDLDRYDKEEKERIAKLKGGK